LRPVERSVEIRLDQPASERYSRSDECNRRSSERNVTKERKGQGALLTGDFVIEERWGAAEGPTVALLAGVHGDEEEGVLAVQRVLHMLDDSPLTAGCLRAVAVAHPAAYAAESRFSPLDGLNLARCFPGDEQGSATERLAHRIVERVLSGADALVDLHSAGRAYAMPLFCGYSGAGGELGERSHRLAEAFAAPIVWRHSEPPSPGRSLATAFDMGIPSVYAECSGGAALARADVEALVAGVFRVLAHLEMLAKPSAAKAPTWFIDGGTGDLDRALSAGSGGRFVAWLSPGDLVPAGGVIGEIVEDDGHVADRIIAPHEGVVVYVRRLARVREGDGICYLAPRPLLWSDVFGRNAVGQLVGD
jgi:predicted deacylase